VQALAESDLVDAYNVMVFATILGAGSPLFAGTRAAMSLLLTGPGDRHDRNA
jgi:hypothetical protein